MSTYRFPKSGRLKTQKNIQELFSKGSSFYIYPFRIMLRKAGRQQGRHQVLFSVSKREFKKAVDRNRIKRIMREAYRLNKEKIRDLPDLQVAYIYTAKEKLDFHLITAKFIESFERLKQYAEKN